MVLAEAGASLGEVTARQVLRLVGQPLARVLVCPGPADVLAGHDESFVHAEVVALCDALRRAAPDAAVLIVGFPPLAGSEDQVRLFDAAVRATCELRGMTPLPWAASSSQRAGQCRARATETLSRPPWSLAQRTSASPSSSGEAVVPASASTSSPSRSASEQ